MINRPRVLVKNYFLLFYWKFNIIKDLFANHKKKLLYSSALPKRVLEMFSNKTWLSISMVIVMEQSISTGFVTFIAKYFQVSFGIPASKANIFTGIHMFLFLCTYYLDISFKLGRNFSFVVFYPPNFLSSSVTILL